MEKLRKSESKIKKITDPGERNRSIKKIVSSSITFSNEIALSREYFEAGEFLYSVAGLIEELDFNQSLRLYKIIIKLWEKQIIDYKFQAKLHEIAELYLRIADLYQEKFQDKKQEEKQILNSIKFLKQETYLLIEFNETRKLARNYENIASLYLKIFNFRSAIKYYEKVIKISKIHNFYDLLSFSFQQIFSCYEEIDEYNEAKEIILDGIEFFSDLITKLKEKNNSATTAQICQILKNLYKILDDDDHYVKYSKKEAGAYIDLAEAIEKKKENYHKMATYYRGAGLCYREIQNNLIECASCFILAGNYLEKEEDFNQAGVNFFDGANVFKELENYEMAYKHFVKAGDNYWKIGNLNESTESYLNAYDVAVEGSLEFNRFGIFNQIIRGLNKIAEEGLKNKQFFTAATLILESIKFYEQLEDAKDFLLREMVNNLYRYYYKAANLKKIGNSHIVHSYVLASISCILNGKLNKAWEIISEIEFEDNTVEKYKKIVKIMINTISEGKEVELNSFPFKLRRLITSSEEIMYLLKLFRGFKIY